MAFSLDEARERGGERSFSAGVGNASDRARTRRPNYPNSR